jgi:hypothetical protein
VVPGALEAVAGGQERGQLLAATDERGLDVRGDAAPTQRRRGAITEGRDHRARGRTRRRIPREERGDQLASSAAGTPAVRVDVAGRFALGTCATSISIGVPSNGVRPVSSSKPVTPSAYRSIAGVGAAPASDSGATYSTVPATSGALVGDRRRQPEVEQHDPVLARSTSDVGSA